MSNETTNFPKVYDPQSTEARIYQKWVDNGYFTAHVDKTKESYTIVIPPPNITGQLHMGHALDNTLQDILIRFKRMQGYSTLWLPGTDHASIATEVKILEALAKEGVTKYDLGRESSLNAHGNGKMSTVAGSQSSSECSVHHWTGHVSALQWMRAAIKQFVTYSYPSTIRVLFTEAKGSRTGAVNVTRLFPMQRLNIRRIPASSGT